MDTVLIVEDDKSFQLNLVEGFKAYKDKFQTIVANDGLEALTILNKQEINLVLTDIKMPRMDGFELMAHLSTNYPEIPVIIMTAFGTPDMERNLKGMGASQYIEKPIDFSSLVEKVLGCLESTSKGFVTGVSLTSFLQLLEIDKKTCTLTIHSGRNTGTIYFNQGDLIEAVSPDKTGIEAAYEIISWSNVKIEIANSCMISEREISEPLGFIILEASRLQDERNDAVATQGRADQRGKTERQPVKAPAAARPIHSIQHFTALLDSKQEISGYAILSKSGNMIQNKISANDKLGNFITYIAAASDEIKKALGTKGGRQFALLTLSDNNRILVLAGKQLVAGFKIDKSTQPEILADRLREALNNVTIKK